MAQVTSGGKTSSSGKIKATPGGSASGLRVRLEEEGKASQKGVVFRGNCDHLWLRPPGTQDVLNKDGKVVRRDPGLFMDFGGVGQTKEYDPTLSTDAAWIKDARETVNADPEHPDVRKYGIKELLPEDPALPFKDFDSWSADAIKTAILSRLGDDHDHNVRVVKEIARYEVANGNRDDVLAMLDGLLATEAAESDAFDVEVSLA